MSDLERVRCPRCRSEQSDVVLSGPDHLHQLPGEFFVAACRQCRLWFQNPRPPIDALASLYPDDYRPHVPAGGTSGGTPLLRASTARYLAAQLGYPAIQALPEAGGFNWRAVRWLDPVRRWTVGVGLLPQFVPDGALLDIGCGNGSRLASLRQYGWRRLHGIELVAAAAAEARANDLAVECGPVESTLESHADGSLDVVISSMVLEHLPDPFAVVRRIAAKLKPGGQFLFSTVVRDSLDARIYGKFWGGFDFPRHLVYFRRADLDAMLTDHYEQAEYFYQAAPVDFLRSSSWRRLAGERRIVDEVIVRLGSGIPQAAWLAGAVLAWLGKTSRVSCRCRRMA
ncbi:MAG: class I SAM-dependent methyltransferase [Acidobacteriota bacterium]